MNPSLFTYTAAKFYYLSLKRNNSAERMKVCGLWPAFKTGYPSYCGVYKPELIDIDKQEFRQILPEIINIWNHRPEEPPAKCEQFFVHEYLKHGTCMFVEKPFKTSEYFKKIIELYTAAMDNFQIQKILASYSQNTILIPLNESFKFELETK